MVEDNLLLNSELVQDTRLYAMQLSVTEQLPANNGLQLLLPFEQVNSPLPVDRTSVKADLPPAKLKRHQSLEVAAPDLTELQQQGLLAELLQLRSLTQAQVSRVYHLEQALDQSLACIKALRQQVIDQKFLENQLAATEEIANVQQQAINQLKTQLTEKQQIIETAQIELQQQDKILQEVLVTLETLTAAQQSGLETLRMCMLREQTELVAVRQQLEAELATVRAELTVQQQQVLELEARTQPVTAAIALAIAVLGETQTYLTEATQQLRTNATAAPELFFAVIEQLASRLEPLHHILSQMQMPTTAASSPPSPVSTQALVNAQKQIGELELQLTHQETAQVLLQHAYQEAGSDRDRQQKRLVELEQQIAELQEQILHQAQQSSEYETAVQHWKDRYINSYQQIQQLKPLLESSSLEIPAEVEAILASLEASRLSAVELHSSSAIVTARFNQEAQLDLPEFLMRRRSYKNRRLS